MATGLEEAAAVGAMKALIAALAKPVASATFNGLKSISATVVDAFGNRLTDYVCQQYERHSCLNTIVFQHQKSLYDLYIPLTVISAAEARLAKQGSGIKVDRFRDEFIPDASKVLITDTAGMGKSTLSKFLFLQCLKSSRAIPFFIELRHLSEKEGVLDVIRKQLNSPAPDEDEPTFNKRQIQRMLKKSFFIFFFDGYDEIPPAHREAVTKSLKELVELYPQHNYIITSRPESGLLAFPSFKQYSIRPLQLEESFALIRKYDEGAGRAEQLIKTLQTGELRSVREFLKNPLLTSLLYRSFEYKQSVPLKKHVFYRQVYDALFDWHDATKDGYNTREKKSGLDIDAFHRMLRVVGFYSVMKGKVEGDTDTVLSWIRTAKGVCNAPNVSESNFLEDLIRAVPIFVKDGDLYRWSHKSLSEYFAAQYICTEGKSDQQRTLEAIMSSKHFSRFWNMLDQIYDVDNNAFREYLVLPAAKAFKTHWESSYKKLDPSIGENEIRLRRSATFDKSIVFLDKFNFVNMTDLRAALSGVEGIESVDLTDSEMIKLFMMTYPEAILSVQGRHCFVMSILLNKRDPLVLRLELVDQGKSRRFPKLRGPITLNDNPSSMLNSLENFPQVTKVLLQIGPTPNSDRLLRFANEFEGRTQLASLTDELLGALNH